MSDLTQKKCEACSQWTPALKGEKLAAVQASIDPSWEIVEDERKLRRHFKLHNFIKALDFVNLVGSLAENEGHHPDIEIYNYNNVRIDLSTHKIKALSMNDMIMAAKIDTIWKDSQKHTKE